MLTFKRSTDSSRPISNSKKRTPSSESFSSSSLFLKSLVHSRHSQHLHKCVQDFRADEQTGCSKG